MSAHTESPIDPRKLHSVNEPIVVALGCPTTCSRSATSSLVSAEPFASRGKFDLGDFTFGQK